MNTLEQNHKIFLLGSLSDIEKLKNKDSAKLLVISDSHGNFNNFKKALYDQNGCDALIFCGDGFYELQRVLEESVYDPETASLLPEVIAFVQGNGDPSFSDSSLASPFQKDADSNQLQKILIPPYAILNAAGTEIFVAHGNEQDVYFGTEELERLAKRINKANLIFFGHTHRRHYEKKENVTLINPGSISRPRDALLPSYCVVKIKDNQIFPEFFEIRPNSQK